MTHRQNGWQAYSRFAARWMWGLLLVSLAIAIGTGLAIRRLQIQSDFKRMLPGNYPSVLELEKIEGRVRSTATLLILIGGDEWPAMRRFIDDLVAQVPERLGDIVAGVDYNNEAIQTFSDRNKYLYVDLADLEEVDRRLERYINYEKIRRSPLYIELGDQVTFDIGDIETKYNRGGDANNRDGYYTNAEANLAIVVLKPIAGATDVRFARELLARTRAMIDAMHPTTYHPSLRVGFGGRYPKMITEYETVLGDARHTILLCALLVGATVLFYFRRLRMGVLMIGAAGLGTLTALAVARFTIGYLTTQTAFLGSIILGNGINYGIILMARYLEERRERHRPPTEALAIAMDQTWWATLASTATTSAAFIALTLAQVRGFSQFGLLGGCGMVICWIYTYTLLPGWILLSERIWPIRFRTQSYRPLARVMDPLSRWIVTADRPILLAAAALAGISLVIAGWYVPRALEYDFNKLRFKPTEQKETWESWAQSRADEIFRQSASPAVFLADSLTDVEPICAVIRAKAANLYTEDGKPIFDQCKTLFSFIPEAQQAKLDLLATMRQRIEHETLDRLTAEQRAKVEELRQTAGLRPVGLPDLPEPIVERFREANGRVGLMIYVYPRAEANLWHGRELVKFADLLREIHLPNGKTIHASGEAVIFSDLLDVVTNEGPRISLVSLLLVVAVVVMTFRSRFAAGKVVGALCLGVIWLIALLPVFGVKLNFLNFVALPIAFGIGVDYAVNIFQRYTLDGRGSMPDAVRHVGSAVLLCSMTTMLGYGVLMISRNGALQSFGLAGLLAEITCLAAALVALPAYIVWWERVNSNMDTKQKI